MKGLFSYPLISKCNPKYSSINNCLVLLSLYSTITELSVISLQLGWLLANVCSVSALKEFPITGNQNSMTGPAEYEEIVFKIG